MLKLTTERFQTEVRAQIQRARTQGRPHAEINAGELHRQVGGYPPSSHGMPQCCNAMRGEMSSRDTVVFEPPKGKGASLTIRYELTR
ncbi:MAG: hypothetical protein MI920_24555 [Kiloniellales bacterium]|nr:hypothetical protein [Kiloniellales bacterium]